MKSFIIVCDTRNTLALSKFGVSFLRPPLLVVGCSTSSCIFSYTSCILSYVFLLSSIFSPFSWGLTFLRYRLFFFGFFISVTSCISFSPPAWMVPKSFSILFIPLLLDSARLSEAFPNSWNLRLRLATRRPDCARRRRLEATQVNSTSKTAISKRVRDTRILSSG